ncbi:MAG: DUF3147 family protein [Chthoniobacterales bacterium]
MWYYVLKVLISAVLIVAVSELSRRGSTFWGGMLASLPLTSLLAFAWLYRDSHDAAKVAALSWSIFWLVLPSLTLFVALPIMLKRGLAFPLSLSISLAIMIAAYLGTAAVLRRFGVAL